MNSEMDEAIAAISDSSRRIEGEKLLERLRRARRPEATGTVRAAPMATIYLAPRREAPERVRFHGSITKRRRGSETILLVEDEKSVLDTVVMILTRLGYNVLATSSAKDAVRLANEHPGTIDLVLTDVIMPEVNGKDLATALLSARPNIKLLFMSGYPADIIALNAILDSSINFLQKPFSQADLAGKMREVLDKDPGALDQNTDR